VAERGEFVPGWRVVPMEPRSPEVELEELRLMVGMLLGVSVVGERPVAEWSAANFVIMKLGYQIEDVRPPGYRT
jgi:hypothetical protein